MAAAPVETMVVAAVVAATVAEETDQEVTVKANAVENGKEEVCGAGVFRNGMETAGNRGVQEVVKTNK